MEEEERMVGLWRCSTTFPSSLWTCLWSTPWLVGGTSAARQEHWVRSYTMLLTGVKMWWNNHSLQLLEKNNHCDHEANLWRRVKSEQSNLFIRIRSIGGDTDIDIDMEAQITIANSSVWELLLPCDFFFPWGCGAQCNPLWVHYKLCSGPNYARKEPESGAQWVGNKKKGDISKKASRKSRHLTY